MTNILSCSVGSAVLFTHPRLWCKVCACSFSTLRFYKPVAPLCSVLYGDNVSMPIPAGSGFPYQKGITIELEDVKLYTRSASSKSSGSRASLQMTIEELYEPPSRACVLLVSLQPEDVGGPDNLPARAILKVVDRRFQGERLKDHKRGWSLEKERLARLRWAGLPGGDDDELRSKHYPYLDGDKSRHWRGLVADMEPEMAEAYFQISARVRQRDPSCSQLLFGTLRLASSATG